MDGQGKTRGFKGGLHFFASKPTQITTAFGTATITFGPCQFFKGGAEFIDVIIIVVIVVAVVIIDSGG